MTRTSLLVAAGLLFCASAMGQETKPQPVARLITRFTSATTSTVVSANASFALSSGGTLYQATGGVNLSGNALAPAGGDQPHNNMQPYLTLNFCNALQGVYPPRT